MSGGGGVLMDRKKSNDAVGGGVLAFTGYGRWAYGTYPSSRTHLPPQ